jgi:hypothetical protein
VPGLVLSQRTPGLRATVLSIVLASLATLLLVAAPAQATANRFTDEVITLDCGLVPDEDGTLLLSGSLSQNQGSFGELVWWSAGADPDVDPPLLVPIGEPSHTFDGTNMVVTVPMGEIVDPATGEPLPVGDATVQATILPNGDPVPISEDERPERGVHIRTVGTSQPVLASGLVTLPLGDPAETVEFAGCPGMVDTISVFATFPDAFVTTFTQVTLICELETEAGFLFLGADAFGFGDIFVNLFFAPADMTASTISGFTESFFDPTVMLDDTGFSASIPLFEDPTGEPAGTATATATFTPTGAPTRYLLDAMHARVRVTEQPLAVSGTLDMPGGLPDFDLSGCSAVLVDEKIIAPTPSGPKPGGEAPANDLPSGAITLAAGDVVRNVKTGGASEAPEAPCLATFDGEVFEVAFGYTVWYAIEGTGAPVTIDTAGTSFDTVIGVYAGEALDPVDCVDDVFLGVSFEARTLQAAITFDTVPGVTYYVQVGGFGDPAFGAPFEFGRLTLRVS